MINDKNYGTESENWRRKRWILLGGSRSIYYANYYGVWGEMIEMHNISPCISSNSPSETNYCRVLTAHYTNQICSRPCELLRTFVCKITAIELCRLYLIQLCKTTFLFQFFATTLILCPIFPCKRESVLVFSLLQISNLNTFLMK